MQDEIILKEMKIFLIFYPEIFSAENCPRLEDMFVMFLDKGFSNIT